jgi:hypothetical protein
MQTTINLHYTTAFAHGPQFSDSAICMSMTALTVCSIVFAGLALGKAEQAQPLKASAFLALSGASLLLLSSGWKVIFQNDTHREPVRELQDLKGRTRPFQAPPYHATRQQ